MNWSDNVTFPTRYEPLPQGYRIVQLDSGHFLWVNDYSEEEGLICWDRFWVRRCAFKNAKERVLIALGAACRLLRGFACGSATYCGDLYCEPWPTKVNP